jgi:hypothetical protein
MAAIAITPLRHAITPHYAITPCHADYCHYRHYFRHISPLRHSRTHYAIILPLLMPAPFSLLPLLMLLMPLRHFRYFRAPL